MKKNLLTDGASIATPHTLTFHISALYLSYEEAKSQNNEDSKF